MAKLSALVKAITAVDGRDQKTIEHVARVVREAGFIPTGKRGGGSAEMTFEAATNLIIALNSAEAPKDAPHSVERMRSLTPLGTPRDFEGEAFTKLDSARNFGDALEILINQLPDWWNIGCQYIEDAYKPKNQEQRLSHQRMFISGMSGLLIRVELGLYHANISFEYPNSEPHDWSNGKPVNEVAYFQAYIMDVSIPEFHSFYQHQEADRKVTYSFGFATLAALYGIVSGRNPFAQFEPVGGQRPA